MIVFVFLQRVLQVELYECSETEEAAFVQYYNLPVKKLKCNKIVRVEDLEKYFPQLNYMFSNFVAEGNSDSSSQPQPSSSNSASANPQKRHLNSPTSASPAKQKIENVVQKLSHERQSSNNDSDTSGKLCTKFYY